MKKLLPIFIILLLSASFVSAGFWDWATGKATDCPPTSLGYRYDSSTDQCTSVTVRGCLSSGYYATIEECQSAHGLVSEPQEPEIVEGDVGGAITGDYSYECQGNVINNLCYLGDEFIHPETYEDDNIQIWADFQKNNAQNTEFDFRFHIKNKLSIPITIDYQYNVRNDVYQKISTDFLTDDNAIKQGLHINLNSNEEKVLNARFGVIQTNILAPFLEISFWYNNILLDPQLLFHDINCLGRNQNNIIWSFNSDTSITEQAICCNDVVYPSADCCSSSDCDTGVCIDGQCMNENRKYPFHGKKIFSQFALAIGTKEVLYLSLSDAYSPNPDCNFESNAESIPIFNSVESFYDNQSDLLLNEDHNFINFSWNFIKINPSDFGITSSMSRTDIKDSVLNNCALNLNNYDLFILEADRIYTSGWCGGPGCAFLQQVFLTSLYSNIQDPRMGNTLTHEINHFFGALDQYVLSGSVYQWNGVLQGPHSVLRSENPNLQIVRAEIGWADLDNNGIIDVVEDSGILPTQAIGAEPPEITPSAPTCLDGIQNQGEEGIDCGGPCPPCTPTTTTTTSEKTPPSRTIPEAPPGKLFKGIRDWFSRVFR